MKCFLLSKIKRFIYRVSALEENEFGQNAYASCCRSKMGLNLSNDLPRVWYQKAADQGLAPAQYEAGLIIRFGHEAVSYLKRAKNQGIG